MYVDAVFPLSSQRRPPVLSINTTRLIKRLEMVQRRSEMVRTAAIYIFWISLLCDLRVFASCQLIYSTVSIFDSYFHFYQLNMSALCLFAFVVSCVTIYALALPILFLALRCWPLPIAILDTALRCCAL